jgi:hypothetical protein
MAAKKFKSVPTEPPRVKKVMLRLTEDEYSKLVAKCAANERELAWSIRKILKDADYI